MTTITLVSEKGAPLSLDEFDDNFRTLRDGLQEVLDNRVPGVGIADITQPLPQRLMILLTNGQEFGPFFLPTGTFRYRGDWVAATNYTTGDFVRVRPFGLYAVLQDHLSDDEFDPDRTFGGNPVYELAISFLVEFGAAVIDASRDLEEEDLGFYNDVIPSSAGDDVELMVQPEGSGFRPQIGVTTDFFMHDPTARIVLIEGGGVTVRSPATLNSRAQWSTISLLYRGGDIWDLSGDLEVV